MLALLLLFTAKRNRAGEMTARLDSDASALMLRLMEYNARRRRKERLAQLAQENEEDEAEVHYCEAQIAFILQKEEETRGRAAAILQVEVPNTGGASSETQFLGATYDLEYAEDGAEADMLIPDSEDNMLGFYDGDEEATPEPPPTEPPSEILPLPANLTNAMLADWEKETGDDAETTYPKPARSTPAPPPKDVFDEMVQDLDFVSGMVEEDHQAEPDELDDLLAQLDGTTP